LCFLFLFGGLGLVVLGIGGNGADFRDILGIIFGIGLMAGV
jgi:hypothetical protein